MANNYTLFSTEVANLTEAEQEWFKAVMAMDGDNADTFADPKWEEVVGQYDGYLPCTIDLEGTSAYLYSEESGDVDGTAALLSLFLRETGRTGALDLEAAFTCSKPRPGEFGGCAFYITADEIRSHGTGQWVAEQYRLAAQ